jgi:TolB-like protein
VTSPDIFLSYNREDQAVVKQFAEAFEAAGLSVWWDVTLRSGEAYDRVTEEALRTARAVVVLWSPRSVDSRWVRAEASIADENGTLVPAKIEACRLPVMFRLTQTAELTDWRGEAGDPAWLAFLGDVRRMVGECRPRTAEAVLERASMSTPTEGGPPLVAVLPVTHRAGDEETDFLAADLTDEITRALGQNNFFKVIAAGTMAAWRGKAADYRQIRHELQVAYALEAKLQCAGEDVRLTVQLIDTTTGGMLKSTRFIRNRAEIADSPDDFPLEVGIQLGETIVQIEMNRAMGKPGPYSGWEHILRSTAYHSRISSDSLHLALEEARQAVAVAPDLGLAHALFAANLGTPVTTSGKTISDELRKQIQMHARRAMQLDGNNPAVLDLLSFANSALDERDANLRLAKHLAELLPNSPLSYFRLGTAYLGLGRISEALAALKAYDRVSRFDANRPVALFALGSCLFLDGRPDEAEATFDSVLALYPDYSMALLWKGIVAASRGDEERAIAIIRHYREVEPRASTEQVARHVARLRHERLPEVMAIFGRLWHATEGET